MTCSLCGKAVRAGKGSVVVNKAGEITKRWHRTCEVRMLVCDEDNAGPCNGESVDHYHAEHPPSEARQQARIDKAATEYRREIARKRTEGIEPTVPQRNSSFRGWAEDEGGEA